MKNQLRSFLWLAATSSLFIAPSALGQVTDDAAPPPTETAPAEPPATTVTTAPAPAETSARAEAPAETKSPTDQGGIFGPIRLGPLISVGLPNLLNFGGLIKITPYFGAGLNVGLIPTLRIAFYGEATLAYQEYDVYGRIFPFAGGFFIGTGVGYEQVRGTLRSHLDLSAYTQGQTQIPPGILPPGYTLPSSFDYDSRGSVRTLVLTPQLGYLYTSKAGFTAGLDVGAQIPIAPSQVEFESTVQPAEIRQLQPFRDQEKKVRDTLEAVGRTIIPTVNFRIGWLF